MTFHLVAKINRYLGAGAVTTEMRHVEAAGSFDSVGMALAHAETLDRSIPFAPGVAIDIFVFDSMGNVWLPGDEWEGMVDGPTLLRLFPEGFDTDREYGRRFDELCGTHGANPLHKAA